MKKAKYFILLFMAVCSLGLSSCTRTPEDGQPAMLKISLNPEDMTEVTTKGITTVKESTVHEVIVFVFYPNGTLISKSEFSNLEDQESINAYSVAGASMNIYVVANYGMGTQLRKDLLNVSSLDSFGKLIYTSATSSKSDYETPSKLLMLGNISHEILAGTNAFDINLNYICAKVTVKIVDNTTTQRINVKNWKLVNAPLKTYIVPHTSPVSKDCLDPASSTDFFSSDSYQFEHSLMDNNNHNTFSETIYMFENIRGGRKSGVTKPSGMSDDEWNGYKGKAACAPDKATYMEIAMTGLNAFAVVGNADTYNYTMKVFFGANDVDDYNVLRGHHYTWTITINDNWDIGLAVTDDTNITGSESAITVRTSSTMNMDAHPDSRAIDISANASTSSNLTVEILDSDGRHFYDSGFDAKWLKISPLDRRRSQISQADGKNTWQQAAPTAGAAGYYVRGRFIPNKGRRLWLTNSSSVTASYTDESGVSHDYTISQIAPSSEMTSPGSYTPPSGITIGSTQYPDIDDAMKWSDATYRMCYKLTDLIQSGLSSTQNFEVYAFTDQYAWNHDRSNTQNPRSAVIRISYYDTGKNQTVNIDYLIQQQPPLYICGMLEYDSSSSTYHELEMERIEEYNTIADPLASLTLQNTMVMQWGFMNTQLYSGADRFHNGFFLTANAVYKDVAVNSGTLSASHSFGDYSWGGTAYRDKYASGRYKSITASPYGKITEPATEYMAGGTYGNTGAPYYFPNNRNVAPASNDVFDPVFNTSAARYCHEKNADIDGDGNISAWETVWYLPSQSEVYAIFAAYEAIQASSTSYGTGFYWSSSENSTTVAGNLGYSSGFYKPDKGATKLMIYDISYRNGASRCVRLCKDTGRTVNPVFYVEGGISYLDLSQFAQEAVTTTSKGSATGAADNNATYSRRFVSTNASTVFAKLRIAKADLSGTYAWRVAVGYPATFPSGTVSAPDSRLGVGSLDLSGHNSDGSSAYCSMGVPATESTGCNAYYEETSKSDMGTWRLPNKKELMIMWIYKDLMPSGQEYRSGAKYWSAAERCDPNAAGTYFSLSTPRFMAWYTMFGGTLDGQSIAEAKTNSNYVRCVKEVYTGIKYKLIYNANGGQSAPAVLSCYGDTSVTLSASVPVHPSGKTFLHWNTSADGTGTSYAPGATFKMGHKTTYLYAIWG